MSIYSEVISNTTMSSNFLNTLYKHFLSPEQYFTYVKIVMTYKGPMWVPCGLKFLYGTHMGPIWALCPDSAHMGPICPCVLGPNKFIPHLGKLHRLHPCYT